MADGTRTHVQHERVIAVAIVVGFAVLVASAVAVYLTGFSALHNRLRLLVPAALGSVRMPSLRPTELAIAAAFAVITIALVALLVHDACQSQPAGDEAPPSTKA